MLNISQFFKCKKSVDNSFFFSFFDNSFKLNCERIKGQWGMQKKGLFLNIEGT